MLKDGLTLDSKTVDEVLLMIETTTDSCKYQ